MSGSIRNWEIPSAHQLKASCWIAHFFVFAGSMKREDARTAYTRAATDGLFDSRDFITGEKMLLEAGLLIANADELVAQNSLVTACSLQDDGLSITILEKMLLHQRPLWISAALSSTEALEEMLPDETREGLANIIPDISCRKEFLLALGRKYDDTERKRTGDIAEGAIVGACRSELMANGRAELAERVQRVSLISDQLGYDVVAPRLDNSFRHIEVKGTRASGEVVSVYISRNEARAGHNDVDWYLTVCRVGPNDETSVIGWLDITILAHHLPWDVETGLWQDALIYLDEKSDLRPGLPPC